jgi:TIR domain
MDNAHESQTSSAVSQKRIFISYRRADTSGEAHAIRERFGQRYGRQRVFMDTDSIPLGEEFDKWINQELDSTAIMLVLIGRRFLGRARTRRIDAREDWVWREISVALDRGIPIIPILVEGTPMPSSEDLPENLRPLIIKQTMSLESSSFESDIARLEQAVALVLPVADQEAAKRKTVRRTLYAAAGAVLIAAIAVILLLTLPGHHSGSKAVPSASSAVLKLQSPDLLTEGLLVKGFGGHLPSDVSSSAAQLSDTTPDGLTDQGLAATVQIPLTGPASAIEVYYTIFQNQGDASNSYYNDLPYPNGYRPTGRLTDVGVGDQTKCSAARQTTPSGSSSWGCLSLSGTVVTFSVVLGDNGGNDGTRLAGLERELAPEVIRNLQMVAARTSHKPLPDPPAMTSAMVMTGSDIYDSLISSFPAALAPSGLSSPSMSQSRSALSGLINGKVIQIDFTGPDEVDALIYYVFGNPSQARSFFDTAAEYGPTGLPDQATGSPSVSGFSSSQQVKCGTWSQRAVRGTPAFGDSDCWVQWGDIVIDGGNLKTSSLTRGNTDIALALARSGVLRLAQIMGS